MISLLHLLWICPLSALIGATALAIMLAGTSEVEEPQDEYDFDQ